MANLFNRIHTKAGRLWPLGAKKNKADGPDLIDDVKTDNIETESVDPRLSTRFSSVFDHIRKNLIDLKSLKNKF